MTDALYDIAIWRYLAHAVVPVIVAASVAPEGSAAWRVTLSAMAAAIIEAAGQVGVDISSLGEAGAVDLDHLLKGTAVGFGGQFVAYKGIDGALGERDLNDVVLPKLGVDRSDLDY